MKIVELTQQLTENHVFLNLYLPQEYSNQKVKITITTFNNRIPKKNSAVQKPEKDEKKEFWFMYLKRTDLSNETFSREEMYDDWGR